MVPPVLGVAVDLEAGVAAKGAILEEDHLLRHMVRLEAAVEVSFE